MALLRIDFSGIEKLIDIYQYKLWQVPLNVKKEMISVCADYVLKEVKKNARSMARGQYSLSETDGKNIANAAFIDTKHMNESTPYALINFKGNVSKYYEPRTSHPRKTRNGEWFISTRRGITDNGTRRIAEVAFLNEYGVPRNKNQRARGFLNKAMEDGLNKSINDLLDILENFFVENITKAI